MPTLPRHDATLVDSLPLPSGQRLNRLMGTLFSLVDRCGWRWATAACALAVMIGGLGVIVTIDELIGPRRLQLMIAAAVICVLAAPCLAVAFKLVEHLGRTRAKLMVESDSRILAEQQLRHLATTDELTGLANRRHFLESGREATAGARRHGQWCSFAIIDLDRFKNLNDAHGHLAGDDALALLGGVLKAQLRTGDLAARLGGDEFVVLMPLTNRAAARAVAERIRAAVRQAGGPLGLSVGIGVASVTGDEAVLEELMARADRALYDAKRAGRNRVMTDEEPATPWARTGTPRLSIAS